MSDKERPRTEADGGGFSGGSGGDDEDDPEEKKSKGRVKKGKRVSLFRPWKGKKLRNRKRKKKGISVNSTCWGRSVGGDGGCCLSLNLKQPRTQYDSDESPTSDPNSPEFSLDMLRDLIEKNDFYSSECNPHLDAEGKSVNDKS